VDVNFGKVGEMKHRAWKGSRKAIARNEYRVELNEVGEGRKLSSEIIVCCKIEIEKRS